MWGQVSHLAGGKQIPGKQRIRCPVSGEQLSLILPPPHFPSLLHGHKGILQDSEHCTPAATPAASGELLLWPASRCYALILPSL